MGRGMKKLPSAMSFEVDGERREVETDSYVAMKVKQLREFGFPTVTAETVEKELLRLLGGQKWKTVIGCMIEGDKPETVSAARRRR